MKLEKAIQQSSFTSESQKVVLNFLYTFNIFKEKQNIFFNPYKITSQQYNVLRILRGAAPEPYSTSQIRDRMLDKMSDASRIVTRLVKKNLVVRTTTRADKRLVDVIISPEGLRLLKKIDNNIDNYMSDLFTNLSKKERVEFNRLLDKIRSN